jgi:hypothetical protein
MYATEPKDRVFALYGVLQALGIDILEPDYHKPLVKVYIEAARVIINQDRNLSILCRNTRSQASPGVPSWIPDWSIVLRPFPIPLHVFLASPPECDGSFRFSEDGQNLIVSGKRLDIIRSRFENVIIPDENDAGLDGLSIHDAKLDQKMIETFQEWFLLCSTIKDSQPPFDGSYLEAFYRTLVQDGSFVEEEEWNLPHLEEKYYTMNIQPLQDGFFRWGELLIANIPNLGMGMEELEAIFEKKLSYLPKIPAWLPEDLHYLTQTL